MALCFAEHYGRKGVFMRNFTDLGFKETASADIGKLGLDPFKLIGGDWMLVSAGDSTGWNTMTASWGGMGVMWGKNTAVTVIRPQRYTKEFIDKNELFTLSFFGEDQRKALAFCGKYSGRDVDKAKETGLVPVFANGTVSFEQARLILVCRKLFAQPIDPACFLDKDIDTQCYPDKDYHVAYVGEILNAYTRDLL